MTLQQYFDSPLSVKLDPSSSSKHKVIKIQENKCNLVDNLIGMKESFSYFQISSISDNYEEYKIGSNVLGSI